MQLFLYSYYVPCIILSNVCFYIIRSYFPFFLIDSNWKQVLLIKWVIFSWSWKTFFCSSQLCENGYIHNDVSTFINVTKLDFENSNIVSAVSNLVNINIEIDHVGSTLFNVVNFNVDIRNVVLTLIWNFPMSPRHITLTTILRQRWNVCWVLKNVAKRLHNSINFIKLKTYISSRLPLNCFFVTFWRGIDRIILVQQN